MDDNIDTADPENEPTDTTDRTEQLDRTPGGGVTPSSYDIVPSEPEEFGLVQVWWGDGKGKTTAALGMGFRAAGHGFRVHLLQFMKGGASSVEPRRGEYNAIEAMPGFTYENTGHYGWHGMPDGSEDEEHATQARAGFERATEIVEASRSVDGPLEANAPPDGGCHMLILDEILYATNKGLVDVEDLLALVESKPDDLELVLTGGHEEPTYVYEHADLLSEVRKVSHPIDSGQRARKGTEY